MLARRLGVVLLGVLPLAGCGHARPPEVPEASQMAQAPDAPGGLSGAALSVAPVYQYDSLDGRPVTSDAMRGRVAVLTFVTTDNLASQVQVNFLANMAKRDGDRVAYALVAMEPKTNRELVEIYRTKLNVSFPVALADDDTMNGGGAFGLLEGVPTTIVLDAAGRIAWRHGGIIKPDQLRGAMAAAAARSERHP